MIIKGNNRETQNQGKPLPTFLPLLPLKDMVIFPNMVVPLLVGRKKPVKALEAAMVRDKMFVAVAQKNFAVNDPGEQDIYRVGCTAEILQFHKLPDGSAKILAEGISRVRIEGFLYGGECIEAKVESVEEGTESSIEIVALMRSVIEQFDKYVKMSHRLPQEVVGSVSNISDPNRLADIITAHINLKVEAKQEILEILDPQSRLERLLDILGEEIEIAEVEKRVQNKVRKRVERSQREFYLNEQLKAIQEELGYGKKGGEIDRLREKIAKMKWTKEAQEVAEGELNRLEHMPPLSAEASVIRTYLEWLTELPWSKRTRSRIDVEEAESILNRDHYALEKVKERILEYLAVCKLRGQKGSSKGSILCLVGAPGVGKTSLAKSIARAMNRNFVRMSLGGVRDEAEIRGHRRTYIGSLPGRIIQGMKKAKSKNPVFLLDEIDKMGSDFRGDPASALMEVLDPEQNKAFVDHYLDVEFDLSEVMFIATANVTHTIPPPLLDRMEVIHIPGYTLEEKEQIARLFLIPKQAEEHGLDKGDIAFSRGAIRRIVTEYTREAGVRELEREIAALCRKVAKHKVLKGAGGPFRISTQNLERYLGPPRYRKDPSEREDRVGVAAGLAVTEAGGTVLYAEATTMRGKGNLTLTGKLGEVMRESAQAALSYVRSRAKAFGIDEDFYEKMDIHIHIPEGAIPKDGPSAGITMASAMVSALTNRPVRRDIAMTGEITLRGRILPVGGLKDKALAAHRAGINRVIIPEDNLTDLEEIPRKIRKRMEFIAANNMDEVIRIALGDQRHYQTKDENKHGDTEE
ncbi:MAG: endopeptidase La [bacterium]